MDKGDWLELQAVIKNGSVITDVEEKNNRIYFKVDGRLFATYRHYVHNEFHPMFDHPLTNMLARETNDPEAIEAAKKRHEQNDKDFDKWLKYRETILRYVFIMALSILTTQGDNEFFKYIDHHLDIMENDNHCHYLIKMLEEKGI